MKLAITLQLVNLKALTHTTNSISLSAFSTCSTSTPSTFSCWIARSVVSRGTLTGIVIESYHGEERQNCKKEWKANGRRTLPIVWNNVSDCSLQRLSLSDTGLPGWRCDSLRPCWTNCLRSLSCWWWWWPPSKNLLKNGIWRLLLMALPTLNPELSWLVSSSKSEMSSSSAEMQPKRNVTRNKQIWSFILTLNFTATTWVTNLKLKRKPCILGIL